MLDPTQVRGRLHRDRQWLWSSAKGGSIVILSGAVEVVAVGGSDMSLLLGIVEGPLQFSATTHAVMELRLRALGLVSTVPGPMERVPSWEPTTHDMLAMAEFASLRADARVERICDLYLRGKLEGPLPRRTQSDIAFSTGLTLRTVTRAFKDLQTQGRLGQRGEGWYYRSRMTERGDMAQPAERGATR